MRFLIIIIAAACWIPNCCGGLPPPPPPCGTIATLCLSSPAPGASVVVMLMPGSSQNPQILPPLTVAVGSSIAVTCADGISPTGPQGVGPGGTGISYTGTSTAPNGASPFTIIPNTASVTGTVVGSQSVKFYCDNPPIPSRRQINVVGASSSQVATCGFVRRLPGIGSRQTENTCADGLTPPPSGNGNNPSPCPAGQTVSAISGASLTCVISPPSSQPYIIPAGWPNEPANTAAAGSVQSVSSSGGTVLANAKIYLIAINHPISYYGNPDIFWRKLSASPMIHILDQYVNATADNRYPLADVVEVDGMNTTNFDKGTLINAAYQALSSKGDGNAQSLTGNSVIYDIFLPDGTTPSGCGVNGGWDLTINGATYTINHAFIWYPPPGCGLTGASANGRLVDSVAGSMMHENFERIAAVFRTSSGLQIADICAPNGDYKMSDGSAYTIQQIFSNAQHACTYSPP